MVLLLRQLVNKVMGRNSQHNFPNFRFIVLKEIEKAIHQALWNSFTSKYIR